MCTYQPQVRYLRRIKGEYYTQEDRYTSSVEGPVEDADTAVLQAKIGPRVQKRREWIL